MARSKTKKGMLSKRAEGSHSKASLQTAKLGPLKRQTSAVSIHVPILEDQATGRLEIRSGKTEFNFV
jgi:hypothetical protein